jgi:hypothetical protein
LSCGERLPLEIADIEFKLLCASLKEVNLNDKVFRFAQASEEAECVLQKHRVGIEAVGSVCVFGSDSCVVVFHCNPAASKSAFQLTGADVQHDVVAKLRALSQNEIEFRATVIRKV